MPPPSELTDKAYFNAHKNLVEGAVASAIRSLVAAAPTDPLAFLAAHIANQPEQQSELPAVLVDEPQVDSYLLAHKDVIAGAVEAALKSLYAAKPDDPLDFVVTQLRAVAVAAPALPPPNVQQSRD